VNAINRQDTLEYSTIPSTSHTQTKRLAPYVATVEINIGCVKSAAREFTRTKSHTKRRTKSAAGSAHSIRG